jgi:hypothetical protein
LIDWKGRKGKDRKMRRRRERSMSALSWSERVCRNRESARERERKVWWERRQKEREGEIHVV